MFRFRNAVIAGLVLVAGAAQAAGNYPGVGRNATPKEVAAWDIDVRPDFKGLPAGSGSVAKGQDVWEAKCSHCHGIFADSGEVFSPLVGVGGISKEDIKTGHASKLTDRNYPGRTTFMKVATLSTIWDYINRAMPWTAPKSLSTEEVYAVTAYLLNLAGIVPDDFTLSNKNIAEVQKLMPNRNGMNAKHAMWPGNEFGKTKPDTNNVACMKDCVPEPKLASFLPEYARNAHGNLAEQNRLVGAQHGADTTRPEPKAGTVVPAAEVRLVALAKPVTTKAAMSDSGVDGKAAQALLPKYGCVACHALDRKIVGPSFQDVAKKHAGKADYLVGKIKSGGSGVWGPMPMPAQTLSESDAKTIAAWLASGAAK